MKLLLSFLLFVSSSGAFSGTFDGPETFCAQIHENTEINSNQVASKSRSLYFKALINKLLPGFSYRLKSLGENLPEASELSTGRSLILTLGVDSTAHLDLEAYSLTKKALKSFNKKLLVLVRTNSKQSCLYKAQNLGINFEDYRREMEKLNSFKNEQRFEELEIIKRAYQSFPKRLKTKWELKTSYRVNDLKAMLESGNYDHMILVSHASDSGRLVDTDGATLPSGIFHDVRSKLKTLSVFSCYSSKVIKTYQLEKNYNESVGTKFFYPSPTSEALAEGTILSAFPSFVKKVSKQIKKGSYSLTHGSQECSLSLASDLSSTNEVAILLEDKYLIGLISKSGARAFAFDCKLATSGGLISVRSMIPHRSIGNEIKGLEMSLSVSGDLTPITMSRQFFSGETLQSSLYKISNY